MFLGGVDSNVRVCLKSPAGAFSQQCVLKGHGNWIRGLAAVHVAEPSGKAAVLVASASQDRTVRLWKVAEATADKQEHACNDAEGSVCTVVFV
jgi:WD40 repeat protein